jgi:tetratricopeptide (TPR) repeat protein
MCRLPFFTSAIHLGELPNARVRFLFLLTLISVTCTAGPLSFAVGAEQPGAAPPRIASLSQAPQPANWHECVLRCEQAVMLVGHPEYGSASAFVISAKNRLLATNAHVADMFYKSGVMTARGGAGATYKVEKVWYHPGVIRKHDQSLEMRCQDPSHGPIAYGSPDVAVLQLAPGPELKTEVQMATRDELNSLLAQQVGMLGFPTCDVSRWPEPGEGLKPSFREGVVTRLSAIAAGDSHMRELQHIQHSMPSWFGFSGAPVILPNGHVVALDSTTKQIRSNQRSTSLEFAVRADCIWELLAYHNLLERVAFSVNKAELNLAHFENTDPHESQFRGAMSLVAACEWLMLKGDFALACENCNQAILMAPGYGSAYRMRSNVLREFVGSGGRTLPAADKLRLLQWAVDDLRRYQEIAPEDRWTLLDYFWTVISVESVTKGNPANELVLNALTKLLSEDALDRTQQAYALFLRAAAGDYHPRFRADLDLAVQMLPYGLQGATARHARAAFWQHTGYLSAAYADDAKANELLGAEKFALAAREIMESRSPKTEELRRASDMLLQACRITGFDYWRYLDSLAMALHKMGDDQSAANWATKALALSPADEKARIRFQLAAYRRASEPSIIASCSGQPFKEVPLQPILTSRREVGSSLDGTTNTLSTR